MRRLSTTLGRLIERNPARPVAESDRRNWLFLATIYIGTTICVPLFALGGALGQRVRLGELVVAILVGATCVAVLAAATGWVGMKARVPTAIMLRHTFGTAGARLVAALLIFTLFGWFGLQTEVLVSSIVTLLPTGSGGAPHRLILTILAGALMSSTAIIGFRALGKVAYAAVPLLLCVIAIPVWRALATHDVSALLHAPALVSPPYSFGVVVSVVTGGYMVAITITPDLTRFLRSPADLLIGMSVSFLIAYPVLLSLSALLAVIYGSGDLVRILVMAGVGVPALLVIVLATWTSNDKNLYESALSASALFPGVERWKLTLGAAVVGTMLAAVGIFEHFVACLIFLGIVIAPVSGVYLVDYLLNRDRYRHGSVENAVVRFRSRPFIAWIVGSLVGFCTLPTDSYGLGLFGLTLVPALDAMMAAALAQWLLMKAVAR